MNIFERLPYIYDIATSDNNWTTALDQFAEAAGARTASIYAFNNTGFVFDVMGLSSLFYSKPECIGEYFERYRSYDEDVMRKSFQMESFRKIEDHELFSPECIKEPREDFRYLRDNYGILRRSAYNLSPKVGWNAIIVTHFDYTLTELPRHLDPDTDLLVRHLAKALEINRFCAQLRQRYQAVLTALDHMDVGICIALRNSEIIAKNKKAKELLAAENGLMIDRYGLLKLKDDDLTSAARQSIQKCSDTASGESNSFEHNLLAPKKDGTDPYLVEVTPLRDGDDEMNEDLNAALVLIIDPGHPMHLSCDAAVRLFKLTDAEASVVSLLVDGKTISEIADVRSVSSETVRNQCKAIHNKMQVRNRAELIKKIVGLSPPVI